MTVKKNHRLFSSQKAVDISVLYAYSSIAKLLKAKAALYIIMNSSGPFIRDTGMIQRVAGSVNRFLPVPAVLFMYSRTFTEWPISYTDIETTGRYHV